MKRTFFRLTRKKRAEYRKLFFRGVLFFLLGFFVSVIYFISYNQLLVYVMLVISLVLTIQSTLALSMMLYAWNKPEKNINLTNRDISTSPVFSFTALLPVRHEAMVIGDTIRAVAKMDYPYYLKQIVVCAREDDTATIAVVKKIISQLKHHTIELVTYDDAPINKPHTLNTGLKKATGDIIVVFDAEDEPHPELYKIVNQTMITQKADVVQSGVQLVNEKSNWFSWFAVLEYYFWFKSALHFFAKRNVVPLGGNTVFFKRALLKNVGGWDESCLTEDAALGIILSARGAHIEVLFDEQLATREEAPTTVNAYVKQRTRWFMGFLQILFSGIWLDIPSVNGKFLALFILSAPFIPALLFILLPLSVVFMFLVKVPVVVALVSLVPVYIVFFHIALSAYGTYTFSQSYKKRWSWKEVIHICRYYLPYQLLLGISSIRALKRLAQGNVHWEKTNHANLHRLTSVPEGYVPASV